MNVVSNLSRKRGIVLACAAILSSVSLADTELDDVVVTATRMQTRSDAALSDVTVINRAQIEQAGNANLPELLARFAGVQMFSSGGLGKNAGVFIRGTESRHTVLLIDGVRYGSATTGAPAWENIPTEMIERIEVLKGPASALYGSDAVGGVVQIFTRRGSEGFKPHAGATLGSFGHRRSSVGVAGGGVNMRYALSVQRADEDGFSATNTNAPFGAFNADRDGFTQESVSANVEANFGEGWRVTAQTLQAKGLAQFDDGEIDNSRGKLRTDSTKLGLAGPLTRNWKSQLALSQSTDRSDTFVASFPGLFQTRQTELSWQNEFETSLGNALAGFDRREQRVASSAEFDRRDRAINSVFAGLHGQAQTHTWQVNARQDRNSQFGSNRTYFAGYGFDFAPGWRLNASYGTSFVAPSFNQLYFPNFGNPNLQPEQGKNRELGVRFAEGAHEARLSYFDNRIRGFISNTTTASNIPRARIDGFSFAYTGGFAAWTLRSQIDAIDPRNALTGKLLARRAKLQATLGADYQLDDWQFGASALHTGERFDNAANSAARRMSAYSTLDLHARWQLNPAVALQLQLANVTDRAYETAFGYNQAERSVFMSVRWQGQ
jgi:vitamin B12 transporter